MNIRLVTISDYEQDYQLWMSCAGMGLNNPDDSKEGIEILRLVLLQKQRIK